MTPRLIELKKYYLTSGKECMRLAESELSNHCDEWTPAHQERYEHYLNEALSCLNFLNAVSEIEKELKSESAE